MSQKTITVSEKYVEINPWSKKEVEVRDILVDDGKHSPDNFNITNKALMEDLRHYKENGYDIVFMDEEEDLQQSLVLLGIITQEQQDALCDALGVCPRRLIDYYDCDYLTINVICGDEIAWYSDNESEVAFYEDGTRVEEEKLRELEEDEEEDY